LRRLRRIVDGQLLAHDGCLQVWPGEVGVGRTICCSSIARLDNQRKHSRVIRPETFAQVRKIGYEASLALLASIPSAIRNGALQISR